MATIPSVVAVVLSIVILVGQFQPGTISGTVLDQAAKPMPGVRVSIFEIGRAQPVVRVMTTETGAFELNVTPGQYVVFIEDSEPFLDPPRASVLVRSGQTTPVLLTVRLRIDRGPIQSAPRPTPMPSPMPPPPPAPPAPPAIPVQTKARIAVFFATDRQRTANGQFSTERSPDATVRYGRAVVSIPLEHREAVVERPRFWQFWGEDPAQHFVIFSREEFANAGVFVASVRGMLGPTAPDALLFIHGFNVAFDDAVYRTAQLSYDLHFEGASLLYSWPSAETLSPIGYSVDRGNADLAAYKLRGFLRDTLLTLGAKRVHIIAHSMGTYVLLRALEGLPAADQRRFSKIFLAAPDIDADLFKELSSVFRLNSESTTLYASANDKAMGISKTLAQHKRAGDAASGMVVVDGVDSIDVSALDTDMVGHSYYGDNRSIIADIRKIIKQGLSPAQRGLKSAGVAPNFWWMFVKP